MLIRVGGYVVLLPGIEYLNFNEGENCVVVYLNVAHLLCDRNCDAGNPAL